MLVLKDSNPGNNGIQNTELLLHYGFEGHFVKKLSQLDIYYKNTDPVVKYILSVYGIIKNI